MSQVTQEDLDQFISEAGDYHMIVMYAKWCGHCKTMIEKLDKLNKFNHTDKVTFLEESQVDRDLLDHFPHVHIYENGKRRDGDLDDLYKLLNVE